MKLKINSSLKKLMQNKNVLYLLFALTLLNILGFLATNNNSAVLLFFVIALACSYLSKNMILILFVSLVATNVITKLHLALSSLKEGMDNEELDEENVDDEEETNVDELKNVDDEEENDDISLENELNEKYMKEIFGEDMKNLNTNQPMMQLNDENTKKIMAKIDEMSPVLNNATKLLNTLQTSGMLKSIMKGSDFFKNLSK